MDIIESKIAKETGSEREIWRWLQAVIMKLGHDGMSSDESAIDSDIGTVLHVKKLPWRRNIDKELGIIDRARLEPLRTFGRQGMKPMVRRRGHALISERDPVEGLPKIFYNNDWIRGLNDEAALDISQEEFVWMEIMSGGED
jgi:hypothetical protein